MVAYFRKDYDNADGLTAENLTTLATTVKDFRVWGICCTIAGERINRLSARQWTLSMFSIFSSYAARLPADMFQIVTLRIKMV